MTTDDIAEVTSARPVAGRRRLLAVGVVIALLAGGVVAAWAATRGSGTGSAAGPGVLCPDRVRLYTTRGGTVQLPSRPTASGSGGRLVPARAPSTVAVCEYVPPVVVRGESGGPVSSTSLAAVPAASLAPASPDAPDVVLTRSHAFDGADSRVAELTRTLQQATVRPRAGYDCAWIEQSWAPQYLVGLDYGDGVVWVASPDVCQGVTNGDAHAEIDLAAPVVQALDGASSASSAPPAPASDVTVPVTGAPGPRSSPTMSASPGPRTATPGVKDSTTATPDGGATTAVVGAPPTGCAFAGDIARNPRRLVWFTPVSVTVCTAPVDPAAVASTSVQPAATAVALADALDALPVLVAEQCPAIGGQVWNLLFRGADGAQAPVQVDAGGCGTATNGARVVAVDPALLGWLSELE